MNHPIVRILRQAVARPAIGRPLARWLLRLDNILDRWINRTVIWAEAGIHPKHRLMDYHRFFLDRIGPADRVLDVGCGQGMVAADLAGKARAVVAVDLEASNLEAARRRFSHPNLCFLLKDATREIPPGQFDVIVLSSVLEHIEDRIPFLRKMAQIGPKLLIRVPLLTRDWKTLYKHEAGLEYRLDPTHQIEYTDETFRAEIDAAGLQVDEQLMQFGEIWARVSLRPPTLSPAGENG